MAKNTVAQNADSANISANGSEHGYQTELRKILMTQTFADLERNFRDPKGDYKSCQPTEGYDHEKYLNGEMKRGLFESILHEGIKVPLWVAELSIDESKRLSDKLGREILFRVIRGHRRFVAAENVNRIHPGHILEIPAIVHVGLTIEEEWSLMADHGGENREEGLSELGQYRACINLFATGKFSQEQIGRMLGETRGWAMRRIWIHQMKHKTPIETEFLKRFDPEKHKPGTFFSFTYKDVETLHKAFNADETSKPKRKPMEDGSEFLKLWKQFEGTGEATPPAPKALSRQKIDERDSFIAGCPALEEYAKFATGRGGNAAEAAKMYKLVEEKAQKADSLEKQLEEANAKNATLQAELDSALAKVTELSAEITALKAEKSAPAAPRKGK